MASTRQWTVHVKVKRYGRWSGWQKTTHTFSSATAADAYKRRNTTADRQYKVVSMRTSRRTRTTKR